jgi:multimeric flavodoxin WrbA
MGLTHHYNRRTFGILKTIRNSAIKRESMKVTFVNGSPRSQGNSATIGKSLVDILLTNGAEAASFELNKLAYRGCQACMACKTTSDKCVLKDDLDAVLEDIRSSDVTILASPVFVGEVTSQMKGLIDRFYSYYKPDFMNQPEPSRLAKGKKLVFIIPQGNPDESFFSDIIPRYSRLLKRFGFSEIYSIRAIGAGFMSDMLKDEKVMSSVKSTAESLLSDHK